MQETWVRSLGLEDPLEKETATHSSVLTWRIPLTEEPGGRQSKATDQGVAENQTGLSDFHFQELGDGYTKLMSLSGWGPTSIHSKGILLLSIEEICL